MNHNEMREMFDAISDGMILILKGHLVIEEALHSAVSSHFQHPDFLSGFNFYRLVSIAKAIFYKDDEADLWSSIEALNRIRNKLAHQLQPPDLSDDLAVLAFGKWRPKDGFSLSDNDTMIAIGFSIGAILGHVSKWRTDHQDQTAPSSSE